MLSVEVNLFQGGCHDWRWVAYIGPLACRFVSMDRPALRGIVWWGFAIRGVEEPGGPHQRRSLSSDWSATCNSLLLQTTASPPIYRSAPGTQPRAWSLPSLVPLLLCIRLNRLRGAWQTRRSSDHVPLLTPGHIHCRLTCDHIPFLGIIIGPSPPSDPRYTSLERASSVSWRYRTDRRPPPTAIPRFSRELAHPPEGINPLQAFGASTQTHPCFVAKRLHLHHKAELPCLFQ